MARRKPKPDTTDAAPACDDQSHDPAGNPAPVERSAALDAVLTPTPADNAVITAPPPVSPAESRPEESPANGTVTDDETAKKAYGPNPFPIRSDALAGVRLQEDKRYRQMQLQFAVKPSDEVRQAVRDAGFQWRANEQAWTKRIDPDQGWKTRVTAEELFDNVAAMIRAEQGLDRQLG